MSQPARPAAIGLLSTLSELLRLFDALLVRCGFGCPPVPEAEFAALWELDGQVEMLATSLNVAGPLLERANPDLHYFGFTRIPYYDTKNHGLRLWNHAPWRREMARLLVKAQALERSTTVDEASLTDTERDLLRAIGDETLPGKTVAARADIGYDGARRHLSNLVKRGYLTHITGQGYRRV
jgi:hypothetical protein